MFDRVLEVENRTKEACTWVKMAIDISSLFGLLRRKSVVANSLDRKSMLGSMVHWRGPHR